MSSHPRLLILHKTLIMPTPLPFEAIPAVHLLQFKNTCDRFIQGCLQSLKGEWLSFALYFNVIPYPGHIQYVATRMEGKAILVSCTLRVPDLVQCMDIFN